MSRAARARVSISQARAARRGAAPCGVLFLARCLCQPGLYTLDEPAKGGDLATFNPSLSPIYPACRGPCYRGESPALLSSLLRFFSLGLCLPLFRAMLAIARRESWKPDAIDDFHSSFQFRFKAELTFSVSLSRIARAFVYPILFLYRSSRSFSLSLSPTLAHSRSLSLLRNRFRTCVDSRLGYHRNLNKRGRNYESTGWFSSSLSL